MKKKHPGGRRGQDVAFVPLLIPPKGIHTLQLGLSAGWVMDEALPVDEKHFSPTFRSVLILRISFQLWKIKP